MASNRPGTGWPCPEIPSQLTHSRISVITIIAAVGADQGPRAGRQARERDRVDAFVTDYPDTAALARAEQGKPHEHVQPKQFDNGLPEEGQE
jgi:hypothetical protein